MKHKVKIMVEQTEPGFFGPKKVMVPKVITVDDRTYRQLMSKERSGAITIDEIIEMDLAMDEDWEF